MSNSSTKKSKSYRKFKREQAAAEGRIPMPKLTEEQARAMLRSAQRTTLELALELFGAGEHPFVALGGATVQPADFVAVVANRVVALHGGAEPTEFTIEHAMCATELSTLLMPVPYDGKAVLHPQAVDAMLAAWGPMVTDRVTGESLVSADQTETLVGMLSTVPGPHVAVGDDGTSGWVLFALPSSTGFGGYFVWVPGADDTFDMNLAADWHSKSGDVLFILNSVLAGRVTPPAAEATPDTKEV